MSRFRINRRFCIDDTADSWHQELMVLAQQVQSPLIPSESYQSRSLTHEVQYHSRRSSSKSTDRLLQDNKRKISKGLLNQRLSARNQHSPIPKPNISIEKNDQESSMNNESQDVGIWVKFNIILVFFYF